VFSTNSLQYALTTKFPASQGCRSRWSKRRNGGDPGGKPTWGKRIDLNSGFEDMQEPLVEKTNSGDPGTAATPQMYLP
jgi:hypothetical protein